MLVADAASSGTVSLRLYAANDRIGYLFNSHGYGRGNEPMMRVTASPIFRSLSSSGFHITCRRTLNTPYVVLAATNLAAVDWQTVATIPSDDAGWVRFEDFESNHPQRFYGLSR
jgi:hypothetical protein